MIKIAISGRAGSGKNVTASIIANDLLQLKVDEYHIAAFATKIKELIQEMFPGCNKEALYGNSELRQQKIISELGECNLSYREASLVIGKLGRAADPNFWVKHLARELKQDRKLFIVSDLRFINEYEWVKANDFKILRIKRNNLITVNDISETEQDTISDDKFDLVADNNGSIEDLKNILKYQIDTLFSNKKV